MNEDHVLRQRDWTKSELEQAGFKHYQRRKEIIFARELPEGESPKSIPLRNGDELLATAGYIICYQAGDTKYDTLDEYHHWPVEPQIFAETYHAWEKHWQPSPSEQHLMQNGCKPFYKAAGVWAQEIQEPIFMQSLEHEEPVIAEEGRVLAIGAQGEPYSMSRESFERRYELPQASEENEETAADSDQVSTSSNSCT